MWWARALCADRPNEKFRSDIMNATRGVITFTFRFATKVAACSERIYVCAVIGNECHKSFIFLGFLTIDVHTIDLYGVLYFF